MFNIHLSEHSPDEIVVLAKVGLDGSDGRVWIELLILRGLEEAPVGIERRPDELCHELPEESAAVDARLVQARRVLHLNAHLQAQIWL